MSYIDNRQDKFREEFSRLRRNLSRPKIAEETETANGRPVRKLDTDQLIRTLEKQSQQIKELQQDIDMLSGELDYLYHNGFESWVTKVRSIKDENPKD